MIQSGRSVPLVQHTNVGDFTSFVAVYRLMGTRSYFELGELLIKMNRLEEALAAHMTCYQINMKKHPTFTRTAISARQLGIVATKQGNMEAAMCVHIWWGLLNQQWIRGTDKGHHTANTFEMHCRSSRPWSPWASLLSR